MGYPKEIYDAVRARYDERRRLALEVKEMHREEAFARIPRLYEIDRALSTTGLAVARAVLGPGDTAKQIETLRRRNLELQQEQRELLRKGGYPIDYLEVAYACPICKDTGISGHRRCACMEKALRQEAQDRLNRASGLSLCTFESFSLDYYPSERDSSTGVVPRDHMAQILHSCEVYADDFSADSPSLFFFGRTGLGKTHLSLAIADRVLARGFGAVYGSIQNFLSKLEAEKFGSSEESDGTLEMLCRADLLILDDVGSEFVSPFTVSALYQIINTRLLEGRPTIVNSNLGPKEMGERYNERIVSRVFGSYLTFRFIGNDIRQLKKR